MRGGKDKGGDARKKATKTVEARGAKRRSAENTPGFNYVTGTSLFTGRFAHRCRFLVANTVLTARTSPPLRRLALLVAAC